MIENIFKTMYYFIICIGLLWFFYIVSAALVATFVPALLKYYP